MGFIKIGFISIIVFMMLIGTVNIINIIDPSIWSKELITSKIANNNSNAVNNSENTGNDNKVN